VWVAVELMRWVDRALEAEREKFDGRERLIVVHGNRLILWAVMSYLDLNNVTITDFKSPFTRDQINDLVDFAAKRLIEIFYENYPEAYPQPLFKNQSKCKMLGGNLLHWLKAAAE
jgi:hypothetical protein